MTFRRLRFPMAVLVAIGVAAALVVSLSATAAARRASAASAGRQFTAKLSYTETSHGSQHGSTTLGIRGHGTFSAKLGKLAALEAAFLSLATGVPLNKIAQGGRYTVQWNIAADGSASGLLVAKLAARGLGTSCVSYSTKHGKFRPGMTFVPTTGAFRTVGGTGAAARWRISATFKLTNIAAQFDSAGSEKASLGPAKSMNAACRRVAAIH
jgi:hypothetical protein